MALEVGLGELRSRVETGDKFAEIVLYQE